MISRFLAIALCIYTCMAGACERPAFVDAVLTPIKERRVGISETYRNQPSKETTCIYAATWIDVSGGPQGDELGVYVALYTKAESKKIAEIRYNIADQIWFAPNINIDPARYRIHPDIEAFGILTSWDFIAGTFSSGTTQLDLFVLVDGKMLQSVLSVPIDSRHSPRNCPTVCKDPERNEDCVEDCGPDAWESTSKGIILIGENNLAGYQDIVIKTSITDTDINEKLPQRTAQRTTYYRWDGSKYVMQKQQ